MLFTKKTVEQKRRDFRAQLADGKLHQFPGAFNPLCAQLIERKGFDGVYVSGAVMAADLCLPDIGIANQEEFVTRGKQIARVTDLPAFIDIDTGFGEPMSAARTIRLMEEAGLAGCHIEDQVMPKRCGHLDGKEIVDTHTMVQRVRAAADARLDPNFVLIARSDARAVEGLEASIDRMKAYVDAGADMIFPEAMKSEKEFEAVREALDVPILANMTEFGKSRLLNKKELEDLGFNVVIYPVTTLRLAMGEVERGLDHILAHGDQNGILDKMQHRKDLYDLLRYEEYNRFDQSLFNFEVGDTPME
ncbi:methylisocitrate lyase [Aquisalinus flavus]|uniref:Methylisocitrate lyase n=1 Tax=Aquisalinus flavus TaxID=1526572 RepID=A0A8J2V6Q0_9PROT|nr:methylisocitrate lyase [Aquisalinus flavus]MBD0426408.1 methylisocitrate lyase [Aquisalinus flavus]UNE48035.1 methylisocitrate lyase [Aquisalinus flavus]GGD08176.1 2-methylisocitrate lyase [Aquisalinus flavus]